MRTITSSAILCLLIAMSIGAQEGPAPWEEHPRALGLGGGAAAEVPGLTYQRWLEGWGWQVTGGLLFDGDGALLNNLLDYSLFAQLLFPVYGAQPNRWYAGRLFWWLGAGHSGRIPFVDSDGDGLFDDPGAYVPAVLAGGGLGIESVLWRNISLPLEFGYLGQWRGVSGGIVEQLSVEFQARFALRFRY